MSNFCRSLYLPLFNCDLSWSKDFIISEISRTPEIDAYSPAPVVTATETNNATFQINNAKFYVPVVTLSINNIIKFLKNI